MNATSTKSRGWSAVFAVAGAGTSAVPHSSVVSHWFDKNRGLALGLAMGGLGLGAALAPSVAQALIDRAGWRNASVTLGAAVLLVACPVILACLREPAQPDVDESMAPRASLAGTSAREALGSSILWTLLGPDPTHAEPEFATETTEVAESSYAP